MKPIEIFPPFWIIMFPNDRFAQDSEHGNQLRVVRPGTGGDFLLKSDMENSPNACGGGIRTLARGPVAGV
jgi:hypothetical protein